MECDMIVRTGSGVMDWWQKITRNAVMNKFESWAAQWLVVVRGWVQSWDVAGSLKSAQNTYFASFCPASYQSFHPPPCLLQGFQMTIGKSNNYSK